jgi:hypothetical protein
LLPPDHDVPLEGGVGLNRAQNVGADAKRMADPRTANRGNTKLSMFARAAGQRLVPGQSYNWAATYIVRSTT